MSEQSAPQVAEFFAGIGLARLGLEHAGFSIAWANDIEASKVELYEAQFGEGHCHLGNVRLIKGADLPSQLAMAWASFPCTDLSLAGARRGLAGSESGTFYEWTRILRELEDARPSVVVAENVIGLATSHGGDDIRAAISELNDLGYSIDVLAIDSRRFVPQSRSRLFIVGSTEPVTEMEGDHALRPEWLDFLFADEELTTHRAELPAPPPPLVDGFTKAADRVPPGHESWWDEKRTAAFLDSLSVIQRERLQRLRASRHVAYRTAYRRTRGGVATWEIRADDIAGCLRTARGGSSKQAVVRIGRGSVRVRWMTPHEYAVLMGAGDYAISKARPLQVMFGFGDAVCVPAVEWLGENYLMPLVRGELVADNSSSAITA